MKTKILTLTVFLFAVTCVYAQKNSTMLIGTWKLLSAKYGGEESIVSKDLTYLKFYTKTHFCSVLYPEDGLVRQTVGGTYYFSGNDCIENVEFVGDKHIPIKNTKSTFQVDVKKNKLYIKGFFADGATPLEEVWERIE